MTCGSPLAPTLWLDLAGFVGIHWLKYSDGRRKWANWHTRIQVTQRLCVHCSLIRACEVGGWADLKVYGTYGDADMAALDMCMWLIMCLSLRVFVCMCVCVCMCITVQECFPICFLCVFGRDERALCSHVCWQEVRHSCTRPQLVSLGILCSFASTHFCSVFFSFFAFFLFLSKSGSRQCLFLFYMSYLSFFFIYIIFPLSPMPCLLLDWFYDRGEIVRTAPSLCPVWSSLLANPAPDSQRRTASLVRLWSRNKLVANENKWKRQLNLAG